VSQVHHLVVEWPCLPLPCSLHPPPWLPLHQPAACVKYWSQKQGKLSINTIIEIKSTYTFDKINMIDKVKSYIKNGYNFKLILDKEDKTDLILNIGA
jgi:hypothetical protein